MFVWVTASEPCLFILRLQNALLRLGIGLSHKHMFYKEQVVSFKKLNKLYG